jgi:hypothetical protein
MKKIALAAFLAMPGSFAILAVACLHPRLRAELADFIGLDAVLKLINRHAMVLVLILSLYLSEQAASNE